MNITPNNSKRRRGKIAQLPQLLRDQINQLLDDGVTYAAIVQKFKPLGVSLNTENLSNWFHGGFQDYLLDRLSRQQPAHRLENKLAPDALLVETSLELAATALELLRTNSNHFKVIKANKI